MLDLSVNQLKCVHKAIHSSCNVGLLISGLMLLLGKFLVNSKNIMALGFRRVVPEISQKVHTQHKQTGNIRALVQHGTSANFMQGCKMN